MVNTIKSSKMWLKSLFFTLLIKLATFFKISFMVGSQCAFFSGVNFVAPLAGAFGGVIGSYITLALRVLLGLLFFNITEFKFLVSYVPGFCASLYWASPNIVIRLFIPLACMVLFIAHPVGLPAFMYTFYWLIPIALYFVRRKNVFLEALGSTFIAHAVGSVVWLYTMPTTPVLWIGLIPIVAVERLLFASGMVLAHYVLVLVFDQVKNCAFSRSTMFITK